jgi:hypothetical protein
LKDSQYDWLIDLEPGNNFESNDASAARVWSPERAPASTSAAVNSGQHMNLSYERLNGENKIPRDAPAYYEPDGMLGKVGESRNRRQFDDELRPVVKGNGSLASIEASSARLLPPG